MEILDQDGHSYNVSMSILAAQTKVMVCVAKIIGKGKEGQTAT